MNAIHKKQDKRSYLNKWNDLSNLSSYGHIVNGNIGYS